jgi:N-acyl-D-aspartate/D-glutamate deacylase
MTARDYEAILAADPEYQAMREAKEAEHAKLVEQRARDVRPLLEDLAAVGVVVDRPSRLLEDPNADQAIYPVLLDHLTRPDTPTWLLEWIGRAFGRKSARAIVWDTLVDLIKSHSLEKSAVEGVMVAISDMAQPRDLATLIDLLADRSIVAGRIFLVSNLMRSKKPEARAALLRNQDDPELAKEIEARLSRSRR